MQEYLALLTGSVPLDEDSVQRMAEGLLLADGTTCKPATLQLEPEGCLGPADVLSPDVCKVADNEDGCSDTNSKVEKTKQERYTEYRGAPLPCVRLTLHEGCNHQVKKMLAACNGNVARLHREAIGPLRLAELDIPVGTARSPTRSEMQVILSLLPTNCRDAKARSEQVDVRRQNENGTERQVREARRAARTERTKVRKNESVESETPQREEVGNVINTRISQ